VASWRIAREEAVAGEEQGMLSSYEERRRTRAGPCCLSPSAEDVVSSVGVINCNVYAIL
jgi:hypothetical protein